MKAPVVEVVRRRGPRPVEPPSVPLPATVLTALGLIVRDMRDVPRDCIRDPAELVIWLRRMAGRVEGVGRMRVAGSQSTPGQCVRIPCRLPTGRPGAATSRDLAEAVFGKGPGPARPPARTADDREPAGQGSPRRGAAGEGGGADGARAVTDVPITIVSSVEAETADVVVCLRKDEDPGVFSDNLTGLCNGCGAEVVFRPTAPKAPLKICLRCALERGQGGTA